jgi:hypothetical protein
MEMPQIKRDLSCSRIYSIVYWPVIHYMTATRLRQLQPWSRARAPPPVRPLAGSSPRGVDNGFSRKFLPIAEYSWMMGRRCRRAMAEHSPLPRQLHSHQPLTWRGRGRTPHPAATCPPPTPKDHPAGPVRTAASNRRPPPDTIIASNPEPPCWWLPSQARRPRRSASLDRGHRWTTTLATSAIHPPPN